MAALIENDYDSIYREDLERFEPSDLIVKNSGIEENDSVIEVSSVSSVDSSFMSDVSDEEDSNDDQTLTEYYTNCPMEDFQGTTGPRLPDKFNVNTSSPLDFFLLLFHTVMFTDMARHTNNYARWKATNGEPDNEWVETSIHKMRAFVGMNILIGINFLPEVDMYWSANSYIGNSRIQNITTCNRFQNFCQYFHVSNLESEPTLGSCKYDRLYKIRPVIQHISDTFITCYDLSREAALDETMIHYVGKLSFRQHMSAKPVKHGIKVWMLRDSITECPSLTLTWVRVLCAMKTH